MPRIPYAPRQNYQGLHRLGTRIGDLMRAGGEAQAGGALRSGQIWGGTLGNIGQGIGQYLQDAPRREYLKSQTRWMDERAAAEASDAKMRSEGGTPAQMNARQDQVRMVLGSALPALESEDPEAFGQTRAALARIGPEGFELSKQPDAQLLEAARMVRGVKEPGPPTSMDAALLAAQRAGDQGKVSELLALKERSSAAGRGPVAPTAPPKMTAADRRLGMYARSLGYQGVDELTHRDMLRYDREVAAAGRPSVAPGGGEAPPEKTTAGQDQSLIFFNRIHGASEELEAIEETVATWDVGDESWFVLSPEVGRTETQKRYAQAQRGFTEARLRKDSGAAIPPSEYENDRATYFVMPGDSPAIAAQKRRARAAAIAGIGFAAGPAMGKFYGKDRGAQLLQMYKDRQERPPGKIKIGRFEVEVEE